ncbi:hemerythrin domain-containing protein [Synechococcus sp. H70.2]|uniref:hemerythrin domain-containing protein n=1 Tax=unclassified Synechococcus TaxID=2626047 RepID=UPI0039C03FBC
MSTLVALWAEQHRVILQLLARLSRASELDLEQRRLWVQRLRQRLSRHIQLERHALYPLLRAALAAEPRLSSQVEGLEQRMRDQIPELTRFLHQAEREPQQLDPSAALHFYQQLRAQFEQEEKLLHPLFAQRVSPAAEQQQLRLFRKRLQASAPSSAAGRRSGLEEWERQAVTRPVLPRERLWPPPGSTASMTTP